MRSTGTPADYPALLGGLKPCGWLIRELACRTTRAEGWKQKAKQTGAVAPTSRAGVGDTARRVATGGPRALVLFPRAPVSQGLQPDLTMGSRIKL